jgi:hypothetical protein
MTGVPRQPAGGVSVFFPLLPSKGPLPDDIGGKSSRKRPRQGKRGEDVSPELNVLALIKGRERYIFVYDDPSRDDLIDTFRNLAADPQLTFSWFDASVLTQKAREQVPPAGPAPAPSGDRMHGTADGPC